jgi:hypothetical protein
MRDRCLIPEWKRLFQKAEATRHFTNKGEKQSSMSIDCLTSYPLAFVYIFNYIAIINHHGLHPKNMDGWETSNELAGALK